ncbi:hypothetical protein ACFL0W_01135 [Nanoarchaeota archaeon]
MTEPAKDITIDLEKCCANVKKIASKADLSLLQDWVDQAGHSDVKLSNALELVYRCPHQTCEHLIQSGVSDYCIGPELYEMYAHQGDSS